ncbi:hypothetical protein FQN60_003613 [Etheostoma spectabile]|uniref:Uncharacterized protein n=1 Tax=Etheostoma spectabile TaxID=54343 RepID=A0A5J5CUY0_9PERO|nr:hypothetical protein FQN60_003613 [Etheostoma spectabile]
MSRLNSLSSASPQTGLCGTRTDVERQILLFKAQDLSSCNKVSHIIYNVILEEERKRNL